MISVNAHCRPALLFLLLFLLLNAFPLTASATVPLRLTAQDVQAPLAGHLEILKDETGSLNIDEVLANDYSNRFTKIPGSLAAGFIPKGAVWLRFTVTRSADAPPVWLLELDPPLLEQVDIYLPDGTGGFETRHGGSLLPFSKREIYYRLDLFRLNLPSEKPLTIYARVASHRSINARLTLWHPDPFRQKVIGETLLHGAYIGIILLVACTGLLYWRRLQENLYGYYAGYVLAVCFVYLEVNGYMHQFVITDLTWLLSPLMRLAQIFMFTFSMEVFINIVNLRVYLPRINSLYRNCSYASAGFFVILTLSGYSDALIAPVQLSLIITAVVSICISLFLFGRHNPGAGLYMIAFGPYFLLICLRILINFGVIPDILLYDTVIAASLAHIFLLHFAVTTHIIRHKEEKDALKVSLAAEHQASEQQRLFLRLISHELRTPLAIIDSTVQVMPLLFDDTAKLTEKTLAIQSASDRMHILLNSCLTDDRLGGAGITLDLDTVDMRGLATAVIERIQLETDRHQIHLDAENNPDDFTCDPMLIDILLGNLLDNAVKYSPNGGDISVSFRMESADTLLLEVNDSGIGIFPDQQNKIFDRYYRINQVPGVSGVGLGLHLVQLIANLHGGKVTLTSRPGHGSTFTVTLGSPPASC
jgi:signal transduction histidine kinase